MLAKPPYVALLCKVLWILCTCTYLYVCRLVHGVGNERRTGGGTHVAKPQKRGPASGRLLICCASVLRNGIHPAPMERQFARTPQLLTISNCSAENDEYGCWRETDQQTTRD